MLPSGSRVLNNPIAFTAMRSPNYEVTLPETHDHLKRVVAYAHARGMRLAAASSSKNANPIMQRISLDGATLLDVFTDRRFGGNQLAVFHDGWGVPDADMQSVARELNFSETVFIAKPEQGGDHKLRIFTPARELPFAGPGMATRPRAQLGQMLAEICPPGLTKYLYTSGGADANENAIKLHARHHHRATPKRPHRPRHLRPEP